MSGYDLPSTDPLFESTRFKSRMIALEFNPVEPGTEPAFINALVMEIGNARMKMIGGIGFIVKHATYFNHTGSFWVILISRDPLQSTKWELVFQGIGAKSRRLNQEVNYFAAGTRRNTLYGASEMFKRETTMLELVSNRIDYDINPVRARQRPTPRKRIIKTPSRRPTSRGALGGPLEPPTRP